MHAGRSEGSLPRRSQRSQARAQAQQGPTDAPSESAAQETEPTQHAAAAEEAGVPAAEAPPPQIAAEAAPAAAAPAAAPVGDDFREVDFDALLGLQGPLIGLFENAAMIVLLAATMLFAAFLLPFTVGRCASALTFFFARICNAVVLYAPVHRAVLEPCCNKVLRDRHKRPGMDPQACAVCAGEPAARPGSLGAECIGERSCAAAQRGGSGACRQCDRGRCPAGGLHRRGDVRRGRRHHGLRAGHQGLSRPGPQPDLPSPSWSLSTL